MLGVVENGTAHKLKTNKYKFAGKNRNGTKLIIEKFRPKKKYKNTRLPLQVFFLLNVRFIPVLFVITEPKEHGFYGGEVAGPIFREIADKCIRTRHELHPALNEYNKPVFSKKI